MSQDLVVSLSCPRLKLEIFEYYLFFIFQVEILFITLLRWLKFTHCVDLPLIEIFRREVMLKRVISGEIWRRSMNQTSETTVEEFLNRSIEI